MLNTLTTMTVVGGVVGWNNVIELEVAVNSAVPLMAPAFGAGQVWVKVAVIPDTAAVSRARATTVPVVQTWSRVNEVEVTFDRTDVWRKGYAGLEVHLVRGRAVEGLRKRSNVPPAKVPPAGAGAAAVEKVAVTHAPPASTTLQVVPDTAPVALLQAGPPPVPAVLPPAVPAKPDPPLAPPAALPPAPPAPLPLAPPEPPPEGEVPQAATVAARKTPTPTAPSLADAGMADPLL